MQEHERLKIYLSFQSFILQVDGHVFLLTLELSVIVRAQKS